MSVRRAMAEINAPEFAEWLAFYGLEARAADPDREPTPDELAAKMAAFVAARREAGGP